MSRRKKCGDLGHTSMISTCSSQRYLRSRHAFNLSTVFRTFWFLPRCGTLLISMSLFGHRRRMSPTNVSIRVHTVSADCLSMSLPPHCSTTRFGCLPGFKMCRIWLWICGTWAPRYIYDVLGTPRLFTLALRPFIKDVPIITVSSVDVPGPDADWWPPVRRWCWVAWPLSLGRCWAWLAPMPSCTGIGWPIVSVGDDKGTRAVWEGWEFTWLGVAEIGRDARWRMLSVCGSLTARLYDKEFDAGSLTRLSLDVSLDWDFSFRPVTVTKPFGSGNVSRASISEVAIFAISLRNLLWSSHISEKLSFVSQVNFLIPVCRDISRRNVSLLLVSFLISSFCLFMTFFTLARSRFCLSYSSSRRPICCFKRATSFFFTFKGNRRSY